MRHRELWTLVVESLDDFKTTLAVRSGPGIIPPSPEDYIADCIAHQFDMSSDEASFVRECFMGILRYEHVCEGVLQGFCDALKRNKQDRYSMYLIAYLMIFRFSEVSGKLLRSLMDKCTSATRLAEYVEFLLDGAKMDQFAAPVLKQWYADNYISDFVIGNLQKHKEEAKRDVLQYFVGKATNPQVPIDVEEELNSDDQADEDVTDATKRTASRSSVSKGSVSSRPPIKAVAPKLSVSTQRKRDEVLRQMPPVDVREMLHTLPSPRPPKIDIPPDGMIPLDGPKPPKDPNAPSKPSNPFIETQRPMQREKLLEEKKLREEAIFQQDPIMRSKLLPEEVRELYAKTASSAPRVKQTTASVRREEFLYRRRDEQKSLELLRKAQEMRDDSEYQTWRSQQEEEARIERETRISERKLEMMIADEDAKVARTRQEQRNAEQAREFRRMMTLWRDSASVEESAERQRRQEFATQLRQEVAVAAEAAAKQVVEEKRVQAIKVKEESQQNEMKTAAAIELERQRKSALIAEIRTVHQQSVAMRGEVIEKLREARMADINAIGTMSIDELREKLIEVKQEFTDIERQRRTSIIAQRTQQRREIEQMAARCDYERQVFLDEKEKERSNRREQAALLADKSRVTEEARLIELQAKLQQKREERKAVNDQRKEEERQRKVEAMLLAGDAGAMEMKKWAEMERGVHNRVLLNQNKAVRELKQDRVKQTMLNIQRETNVIASVTSRNRSRVESDNMMTQKKVSSESDAQYDDDFRRRAIEEMRREKAAMRTRTA